MKKLNTLAETASNDVSKHTLNGPCEGPNGKANPADFRLPSVLVGRIVAIREDKGPLVDFPGNVSGELVPARSLVAVAESEIGRDVALTFEDGDPSRPIIAGILQQIGTTSRTGKHEQETLLLTAKKEIIVQCGKASITLTSAGKLMIQGEYVVSRSSGVNKIRGGSIQLN